MSKAVSLVSPYLISALVWTGALALTSWLPGRQRSDMQGAQRPSNQRGAAPCAVQAMCVSSPCSALPALVLERQPSGLCVKPICE